MKYVLIVCGGMSGQPVPKLGNKTCLATADTPTLDRLAVDGVIGLTYNAVKSHPEIPEASLMSLLGYKAKDFYPGISALLARRHGIELDDKEAAFACELVAMENGRLIAWPGRTITEGESRELIDYLNANIHDSAVKFVYCEGGVHLMRVMHGGKFNVKTYMPYVDPLGNIRDLLPRGSDHSRLWEIMENARTVLKKADVNSMRIELGMMPANSIWPWDKAEKKETPKPFTDKYALKGCMVCDNSVAAGMGLLIGLKSHLVPSNGKLETINISRLAEATAKMIDKYEFVCVHTNLLERVSRQRSITAKTKLLSAIDRMLIKSVLENISHEECRILVTADCSWSVYEGRVGREPIPFVMYGNGVGCNKSFGFSEEEAKIRKLKIKRGWELMDKFTSFKSPF